MVEQKQLGLFGEHNTKKLEGLDTVSQQTNFLALSLVRGIGFQTLRRIFERFGRFDTVWSMSENEIHQFISKLSKAGADNIAKAIKLDKEFLLEKANSSLNNYRSKGIDIIFKFEKEFPKSLAEIPDSPYWLFVEGNQDLLNRNNLVAVVGNRTASAQGIASTRKISAFLSKNGFPIVSGLAEGIDAVAHQTAVDYGNNCIAILGTGISIIFPASTANLRSKILQTGGVVITEYLPDDSYNKSRFIQRDRLQAALSRLVIPVEWAANGGTAHTIQFAEKYKRPVIFVNGVKNTTIETDANLYTSVQNRYIVDISSPNFERDILNILDKLQIRGTNIMENRRKPISMFQSVIDEFNRILDTYEIDNSEFISLSEELKTKWSKKKNNHDC